MSLYYIVNRKNLQITIARICNVTRTSSFTKSILFSEITRLTVTKQYKIQHLKTSKL